MRQSRTLSTATAAILTTLLLAACGGSKTTTTSASTSTGAQNTADQTQNTNGNEVIAQVGTVPITKAQVNHWMLTLGASVYYFVSHGSTVPEGLLSDPPDYPRCVASLETAASRSPLGHAREDSVELLAKCRELNQALKAEATRYLIKAQQTIQIAEQLHAAPTPTQTQAVYQHTTGHEYPTPGAINTLLTTHKETHSDLLLEAELTAIAQKLYPTLAKTPQGIHHFLTLLTQQATHTTCQTTYTVEGCQHNTPTTNITPKTPASALMEQVTAMTYGWCVDLKGCAKQIGK